MWNEETLVKTEVQERKFGCVDGTVFRKVWILKHIKYVCLKFTRNSVIGHHSLKIFSQDRDVDKRFSLTGYKY